MNCFSIRCTWFVINFLSSDIVIINERRKSYSREARHFISHQSNILCAMYEISWNLITIVIEHDQHNCGGEIWIESDDVSCSQMDRLFWKGLVGGISWQEKFAHTLREPSQTFHHTIPYKFNLKTFVRFDRSKSRRWHEKLTRSSANVPTHRNLKTRGGWVPFKISGVDEVSNLSSIQI